MFEDNPMSTEELQQAFCMHQRLLEALQKYGANMSLSAAEKRLLFTLASQWHQLSSDRERRSAAHPLSHNIAHIDTMTDAQVQSSFSHVRDLFIAQDLLWINVASTMFNLEETAETLTTPERELDAATCRNIQNRRTQWRSTFLQIYKEILQDLCKRHNQHTRRFWVEEYLENLRRHLEAWQQSNLPGDKIIINLSNCDLGHVDLNGISLKDVDLRDSSVHYAQIEGTGVSAAQLACAFSFSTVQGVPPETIDAAREICNNGWLERLNERVDLLADIARGLKTANQIFRVNPNGNLDSIAPEERALLQWALLTNSVINTIPEGKPANIQVLTERGESWFLNLSAEERDNYWVMLLAPHNLQLPAELLSQAQCKQLNLLKAKLEGLSLAQFAENRQFEDLTPTQQKEIQAQYTRLISQQQELLAEQQALLEKASRWMILLQLDKIEADLMEGNIEKARTAFSNLLFLAKESGFIIDFRSKRISVDLFKGMALEEVRLYFEPEQLSQLSLIQRRAHSNWLFRAIDAGNEESVRRGVEEAGWEINLHNEEGRTPLISACFKKNLEIAKYLRLAGASVNAHIKREGEPEGGNVLTGVAHLLPHEPDYKPVVEWLLAEGIEVSLENALALAVALDDPSLFEKSLKEHSATAADLQKLLRVAVQKDAVQLVKWLIQHRKESLQQPTTVVPLLHSACAEGHVEIVRLLLETKRMINTNSVDKSGRTALVYLAEQYLDRYQSTDDFRSAPTAHYAAIVDLLCQNGATHTIYSAIVFLKSDDIKLIRLLRGNTEEVCDRQGNKPLHIAVKAGRQEVVELLLEQKVTVDSLTKNGVTALQLACEVGLESLVALLLRAGADPTGPKQALTPEQYKLVLVLKDSGLRDTEQFFKELRLQGNTETPLHRAAKAGNVALIQLLCQFRADVEAKQGDMQKTPLHLAVQKGHAEVIDILLQYGAHVTTADAEGSLPFHLALRSGHVFLIPRLEQALMEQKDKSGKSTLDLAKTDEEKEICARYISVNLPAESHAVSAVSSSSSSSSSSLHTSSINDERMLTSLQTYIGPRIGNRRQVGIWESPAAPGSADHASGSEKQPSIEGRK